MIRRQKQRWHVDEITTQLVVNCGRVTPLWSDGFDAGDTTAQC